MLKGWRKKSGKKHHHHDKSEHERFCIMSTEERHEEYMKIADEGWNHAWDIYHSDGWKISSGKDLHSGLVYTKHFSDGGKIFKLDGIVEATPQSVFDQLVHGDSESPAWNPTVMMCKTLQKLNSHTDIAYNIAAPGAGGLVSSRDFVNLRHWKTKGELTLSLGLSTCHPDMPPGNKYVRAENKPAAWVFKPVDGGEKCHFTLILKTDLKGWLPHYLVDQAMTGCLVNYIKYLRDRMNDLKNKQDGKTQQDNSTNNAKIDIESVNDSGIQSCSSTSSFQSCDSEENLESRMEELDLDEQSIVSR